MVHKTIIANTFFQVLAKVLTTGVGFLITILIARHFGAAAFGDYTKIITFVGFFYLAVDFGFNAIFLKSENENHFSSLFSLRMAIALLLFVLCNVGAFFLPYNALPGTGFSPLVRIGILLFSLTLFSQAVFLSVSAIFQKTLRYDKATKALIGGSLVNVIFVAAGVALSLPLLFIILASVFGNVITAALGFYFAENLAIKVKPSKAFALSLFRQSWPIGLMLVFNLIYFRADIFLLSFFRSSSDVGIYGLSYRFFDFLLALPLFLSNALYPILLQKRNDKKEFLMLFKKYSAVFLLSGIFLVVPFWFASPLFGLVKKDFIPAIVPFRILLLSLPIFFMTSFFQWILISLSKQKFLCFVYLFSTILNIILNLVFIKEFGYIASAVITGISEGVVLIALTIQVLVVLKKKI